MGRLTRRAELTRKAESDKVKGIFLYENTIDDTNCFLEGEYGYKAFEKLAAYEDIIDNPEKLKLIDGWYSDLCKENGQLKKELAEYKKLEENGLLLRLPCKVGDKVYNLIPRLKKANNFQENEVITIKVYSDSVYIFLKNGLPKDTKQIGKTVFLTQEEAEQALERMKEVQDVN